MGSRPHSGRPPAALAGRTLSRHTNRCSHLAVRRASRSLTAAALARWASGSGDFAAGPATRQEHALVAFGFVHLKPLWHLGDGRRAGLICSLSPGRDQQVRRNTEPRVGEQVQRG
jgi:hypothetical protein